MSAKLIGLFSGFPTRHFPEGIAARLNEALIARKSLVFISAWPDEYARNDADSAGMHAMFAEYGMAFDWFSVIDRRTAPQDVRRMIETADCVFLMGGHPTMQRQLIREKGLEACLHRYGGVLLGVSAGSINMARRALDVWESPVPYEGLGLTGITVKAHVNPEEHALLDTLCRISQEQCLPVCAMEDESAIFICGEQADWTGNIRYVEKGEVRPLTQEQLNRMVKAE